MEIVIDIDENLYTRLFDNGVDNYDDAVDMAKANVLFSETSGLGDVTNPAPDAPKAPKKPDPCCD